MNNKIEQIRYFKGQIFDIQDHNDIDFTLIEYYMESTHLIPIDESKLTNDEYHNMRIDYDERIVELIVDDSFLYVLNKSIELYKFIDIRELNDEPIKKLYHKSFFNLSDEQRVESIIKFKNEYYNKSPIISNSLLLDSNGEYYNSEWRDSHMDLTARYLTMNELEFDDKVYPILMNLLLDHGFMIISSIKSNNKITFKTKSISPKQRREIKYLLDCDYEIIIEYNKEVYRILHMIDLNRIGV